MIALAALVGLVWAQAPSACADLGPMACTRVAIATDDLPQRVRLLSQACHDGASVACGIWAREEVRGQAANPVALDRAIRIFRSTCGDGDSELCVGAMDLFLAPATRDLARAANWASRGCRRAPESSAYCALTLEFRAEMGDSVDVAAVERVRADYFALYHERLEDYAEGSAAALITSYYEDVAP